MKLHNFQYISVRFKDMSFIFKNPSRDKVSFEIMNLSDIYNWPNNAIMHFVVNVTNYNNIM